MIRQSIQQFLVDLIEVVIRRIQSIVGFTQPIVGNDQALEMTLNSEEIMVFPVKRIL